MARLTRVPAKVFASMANTATDIGQFGSAKSGTKVYTGDVATIQALPAYEDGWADAVLTGRNYPTMQEFNGLLKVMSYQTAYTMQEGIPEYDASTVYYNGSVIKAIDNENKVILYQSIADNNSGNPLSDTTKWQLVQLGGVSVRYEASTQTLYIQ